MMSTFILLESSFELKKVSILGLTLNTVAEKCAHFPEIIVRFGKSKMNFGMRSVPIGGVVNVSVASLQISIRFNRLS